MYGEEDIDNYARYIKGMQQMGLGQQMQDIQQMEYPGPVYPGYEMQQMAVPCATVTVVSPSLITATNIVVTPGTCIAPCNVNVDVTWTNQGGSSGTFTPGITVNGGSPMQLPAETVAAGASITRTWTLIGLTQGTHTICPTPN